MRVIYNSSEKAEVNSPCLCFLSESILYNVLGILAGEIFSFYHLQPAGINMNLEAHTAEGFTSPAESAGHVSDRNTTQ